MPHPPFRSDAELHKFDLDVLYYTLAMTYLEAASKLTVDAVSDFIPGQVYTTCVRAGWIEDQGNPSEGVELGEFMVTKEFRDAWMSELGMSIADMVEIAKRYEEEEKAERSLPSQTPRDLINGFKELSDGNWTNERIAERIGCDPQTVWRIINLSDKRARESNLRPLADLMRTEYPDKFGSIHWLMLRWRRARP